MDAIASRARLVRGAPRLGTVFLVALLSLVCAIVGATVFAIVQVIDRSAREELDARLARGAGVFRDLASVRAALYRAEVHTVADSPTLRALVATEDIDRATVAGVAADTSVTLRTDLFVLAGDDARLLATIPSSHEGAIAETARALIRAALRDGDASLVWASGGRAFQLQARRIMFGDGAVGAVLTGYALDDEMLRRVQRLTSDPIVLVRQGRVIAAALPAGVTRREVERALARGDGREVQLGATRYVTRTTAVPGYQGEDGLHAIVLSSLDQALAPSRRLSVIVYGLAALALLVAFALATYLARRLSRPLHQLAEWSHRVAAGDLDAQASVGGVEETRTLAGALQTMVGQLKASREQLLAKERLENEMRIASRLQSSILPRRVVAEGLDIAARMVPATEVGGDYYDVIPTGSACWIGIGDVSGHGLPAGLVMRMAQTAVCALVREHPAAGPAAIVPKVNAVLFENLNERLRQDEHMTFCLLRHDGEGRFRHAGAHEEMLVYRRASSRTEIIATSGTWLGVVPDVASVTNESSFTLDRGDVLVLFTDGVTEGRTAGGHMLDVDGLASVLETCCGRSDGCSATQICERLMGSILARVPEPLDDLTLLIVRRP